MQADSLSSKFETRSAEPERDEKWAESQYDLAYDHYFKGDWIGAERHIRQAIEVNAFDGRYRLLCAQVYCARGWHSMALSELHILRGLDPNNAGAQSLALLLKAKMQDRRADAGKSSTSKAPKTKSPAAPPTKKNNDAGWKAVLNRAVAWMH